MNREFVVDTRTGVIRQAGTVDPDQNDLAALQKSCERSLFMFGYGILGLDRMTRGLHAPVCRWLQQVGDKKRKLLLLPRDHLKTSIMRSLALHILIQPRDHNLYFSGREGASTRILYAGETATNTEHQLRWIAGQLESNRFLRALWPHCVWGNARKESRKWNEKELLIPRSTDFPEASIETIGVGGAVTGRHYDVFIKDDLISLEAANSQLVMHGAIEWHKTSRALMDDPNNSLEFMIGTRWANFDLYQHIIDNDPSVEVLSRAAIEDGAPIFPEMFSLDTLEQLRRELGPLYFLLYMNSAADPSLTDFMLEEIRTCKMLDYDYVLFSTDERDTWLDEASHAVSPVQAAPTRGVPLNATTHTRLFGWQKMREQQGDHAWN